MWSTYTFGLLCALAVAVSACVKVDRNAVLTAAMVISLNWLLFAMAWIHPEASPAFVMTDLGVYMTHEDTWSVMDLVSLMIVGVVCRRFWWSPILWSAYLVDLAMLAVAWANGLKYLDYRRVLDAALILQLATLFVVGGGDARSRLSDWWGRIRLRHLGWAPMVHRSEAVK